MFAASKTGGVVSAGAPAPSGDPYWSNVSLLTNFENNLSFQDGSTNNFAITRTGAVNPSLNTPFTGGVGGSVLFNGSTGYLTIPNNTALQFGTGDFTVEFWIKTTDTSANIVGLGTAFTSGGGNWMALIADLGTANFYWQTQNGVTNLFNVVATSIVDGAWHHVAVARSGTSTRVFFDGVAQGASPYTDTTNYNGTDLLRIGYGGNGELSGNISNLRIVKGTAVYTANFTPPTAPLTAITNTSLLITGTGQGMFDNATFVDQSPIASTLTATGTPVYSGLSPFGNTYAGSVLFNGASQYLTSSYSTAAFDWWVTDFTIEAWVYPTTFTGWSSSPGLVPMPTLIGNMNVGTGTNYWSFGPTTAGVLSFSYYYGFTTNSAVTSTTALALNQWNHIAMTKTSSGILLFVNGIAQTTTVIVGTPQSSAATPLAIGQYYNTAINGYVSNIRIVKGTALYTANFTPSTTPLTAVTGTSLLVRGDTGGFYDVSTVNNTVNSINTAQIASSVVKYGTGSAKFTSSSGSTLTVPNSAAFNLSTVPFTIELWIYPRSNVGFLVSKDGFYNFSFPQYTVGVNSSGNIRVELGSAAISGSFQAYVTTSAVTLNQWSFVAVSVTSTTVYVFIDGVLGATGSRYSGMGSASGVLQVGYQTGQPMNLTFDGYIDDLRITKGVARYTANFTPPAAPFPTS